MYTSSGVNQSHRQQLPGGSSPAQPQGAAKKTSRAPTHQQISAPEASHPSTPTATATTVTATARGSPRAHPGTRRVSQRQVETSQQKQSTPIAHTDLKIYTSEYTTPTRGRGSPRYRPRYRPRPRTVTVTVTVAVPVTVTVTVSTHHTNSGSTPRSRTRRDAIQAPSPPVTTTSGSGYRSARFRGSLASAPTRTISSTSRLTACSLFRSYGGGGARSEESG